MQLTTSSVDKPEAAAKPEQPAKAKPPGPARSPQPRSPPISFLDLRQLIATANDAARGFPSP